MAADIELSVVIVNWNTGHLLDECLASVQSELGERPSEIIVVDNGSSDDSLEILAGYERVKVIALDENVGYQAACNRGSAEANAPMLVHINSDARMTPGSLQTMLDVFRRHPDVGVVGPRLVYEDGSFQRWTAGQLPSLGSLGHSFLLGDVVPGRGLWVSDDHQNSGEVGWVSSACLLVRAEVLDGMGGLDESFFAYMDDVDLCQRAKEDGWTAWYEPTATVIHLMGGSQAKSAGVSPMAVEAMVQWFQLRQGRLRGALASLTMALGFLARAAVHLARRNSVASTAHWNGARIALAKGFTT